MFTMMFITAGAPDGYVVVERPAEVVVAKAASPVVPAHQITGETVAVTATLLNVRSGPGLNFPVVRQVRRHDSLAVHGYAPDWLYVKNARRQFRLGDAQIHGGA